MTEELTFLQHIARAYQREDYTEHLAALFNKTDLLAMDDQFALFMAECLAYRDRLERLGVLQQALSIGNHQNLAKHERNQVEHTLESLLDDIDMESDHSAGSDDVEIRIFLNNTLHHQIVFSHDANCHIIEDILPGTYLIKLSTGRTVWERQLTRRHVLLEPPMGQAELRLAAQTGPGRQATTLEDDIMERVRIRIYAGTNGGAMKIELL